MKSLVGIIGLILSVTSLISSEVCVQRFLRNLNYYLDWYDEDGNLADPDLEENKNVRKEKQELTEDETIERILNYSAKIRNTRYFILGTVLLTGISSIVLGILNEADIPEKCRAFDKTSVILVAILTTITASVLAYLDINDSNTLIGKMKDSEEKVVQFTVVWNRFKYFRIGLVLLDIIVTIAIYAFATYQCGKYEFMDFENDVSGVTDFGFIAVATTAFFVVRTILNVTIGFCSRKADEKAERDRSFCLGFGWFRDYLRIDLWLQWLQWLIGVFIALMPSFPSGEINVDSLSRFIYLMQFTFAINRLFLTKRTASHNAGTCFCFTWHAFWTVVRKAN